MSSRITAMEIESQTFGRKFRGYDPGEVDLWLRSVAEEVGRLSLENGKMLEEKGRMVKELEELRSREQTLQKTLVSAQRMTDQMKERAAKEGDLVLQEARMRAEKIVTDAHDRLSRIEMDVNRSNVERETFERRLRGILEQHLALLDLRQNARGDLDNLRMLPHRAGSETG